MWLLLRCFRLPTDREDVSHWFDMVSSALHLKPMFFRFFLGEKTTIFLWGEFQHFTPRNHPFFSPIVFCWERSFPQHPRYPRFSTKKTPKSQRQPSQPQGIELRTPASSDVFVGRFSNATKPQVFIEDL